MPRHDARLPVDVYIAGPFFTPEAVAVIEHVEDLCTQVLGLKVFSPRGGNNAKLMNAIISTRRDILAGAGHTGKVEVTPEMEVELGLPEVTPGLRTQVFNDNTAYIDMAKLVLAFTDDFDAGCFGAGTRLPLLSGGDIDIADMVPREDGYWLYSYDKETGRIIPGWTRGSKCTKRDEPVVRVYLDNCESVVCTLDHPWMTRDGDYTLAQDLKPDDSLMPLYRTVEGKYESVWHPDDPACDWELTHVASARWLFGDKVHSEMTTIGQRTTLHHEDFNSRNNSPTNLVPLGHLDHLMLHAEVARENLARMWADPVMRERLILKSSIPNITKYNTDPRYAEMRAQRALDASAQMTAWLKAQHKDPEWSAAHRKRSQAWMSSEEFQSQAGEASRLRWADPAYKARVGRKISEAAQKRARNSKGHWVAKGNNHKVAAVEDAGRADVYGIQVDSEHNYALSAGVFVSNTMWEMGYAYKASVPTASYTVRDYGTNLMLAESILGHARGFGALEDLLRRFAPAFEVCTSETYAQVVADIQARYLHDFGLENEGKLRD
jgi:nucleoside 2-deoxyribosyltransferase